MTAAAALGSAVLGYDVRPGSGRLFQHEVHSSGAALPGLVVARAAAGVAFWFYKALREPDLAPGEVLDAVEAIAPVLSVAGRSGSSAVVLGHWIPIEEAAALTGELVVNDRPVAAGRTTVASAVVRLAERLGGLGEEIAAGHFVVADPVAPAASAGAGDALEARFPGLGSAAAVLR